MQIRGPDGLVKKNGGIKSTETLPLSLKIRRFLPLSFPGNTVDTGTYLQKGSNGKVFVFSSYSPGMSKYCFEIQPLCLPHRIYCKKLLVNTGTFRLGPSCF